MTHKNPEEVELSNKQSNDDNEGQNNLSSCEICEKPLVDLKKHVLGVHDFHEGYQCNLCEKYFNGNGRLREHIRIIVGLRCGFEGRVTTSVEFKSVPRKIFGPSDPVRYWQIYKRLVVWKIIKDVT